MDFSIQGLKSSSLIVMKYGMQVMWESFEPFTFMVEAPGAFVCLGLLLGMINLVPKKA